MSGPSRMRAADWGAIGGTPEPAWCVRPRELKRTPAPSTSECGEASGTDLAARGYAAARLTALAMLGSLERAIGDLDRVRA